MGYQSKKNNFKFNHYFCYQLIYIIILFNISQSNNQISDKRYEIKNEAIQDSKNDKSIITITFINKGENIFFSCSYKGYQHNQEGENSRKEICDYNSFKCNIIEQEPKTVLLNFDKGEIEHAQICSKI